MARTSRIPPIRSGQARRSGGFFGKFVAVLLGFIFGVIATIGGIAGAGYYIVAKITVKDAVNTVNKYAGTDINYSEYVTEEYASQTVLQLVGSLSTVAQEFSNGNGSLNTLNAISPKVGESVSNLLKSLEAKDFTVDFDENGLVNTVSGIGLTLDYAELMAKKFSELGGYLNEQVNAVEIGGVLEMFEQSNELLDAICYGEEYVDYVKDENGDIQMLGSSTKLTVGDLRSEGGLDFEKILTRIPLDALPLDTSDALFSALIYGNENRYDTNDNGKVTMKQMSFTVDNGLLYDIDGNKMQATENGGVYTVTDGDDTYYVTQKDGSYVAFIDEELTIAKRYQKTTVSDFMNGSELFEKIELGTMLKISPLDENADPIMVALAYGEEGTHYELIDTNSDGKSDTIKWLSDESGTRYKPRTLGIFFDPDTDFMELLEDVKLSTLLEVSPLDPDADPLKVALAFGSEGTHYNIVDGEIVWLADPKTGETYKARTLGVFFDPDTDFTELFYDVKLSTLLKVSPLDENPDPLKVALAFGSEGTHYEIVDGEIVWLTDENDVPYTERTLGVFFDENTDLITLFEDIPLSTLLDVSPLDENPDTIKLALAFGEEGTHYEIVDGKIVWRTDPVTGEKYKERTLGAIIGEDSDVTALFYDIKLGTLFEISPLNKNPDKIKLALAYGTEGKHYEIKDGEIVWLTDPTTNEPYKARTIGIFFDEDTDILELLYDVELSTLFEISPLDKYQGKSEPDAIKLSLAFGEEGKHYKLVDTNGDLIPDTIEWLTDPATGKKYAPRTLSVFFDENTDLTELFYDIKLATILDVDTNNKMMMALAYGNADRYTIVGSNVVMNPVPYAIVGGKVYNADYEQVATATVANETLGIYKATIDEKAVYLRESDGVYFAYETLALAQTAKAADRLTYKERTLNDLTGSNASTLIDDIELGAVLETDVLTCSDELVRAIAYGYDGTHYDLIDNNSDGVADSVIWKVKDPITGERYKPRKLSDLDDISTLFDDIRLSSALAITPSSHPIMIALAYGSEGTDFDYVYDTNGKKVGFEPYTQPRTIADLKDNGTELLNGIELTALFTDAKTDDKVTMYLLYGKQGLHYKLNAYGEPEPMKKRIAVYGTTVYDEYGNLIENATVSGLTYTDPDGNVYTLYTPVEGEQTVEVTVGTETKAATYYYLRDASGKDVYFAPRTLGDLTTGKGIFGDITTALTVRDLMNDDETIDSHFILKHMADVPVANLPERIEGLTFQEVYANEIYKKDADGYYLDAEGNYLLDHNGNKFKDIYYDFHDKTFYTTETFEPGTDVHLTLTGQWKYLLTNKNKEEVCQLTDITRLIENMTKNVHYAPLNDLVDDGLVELNDKTLLDDPISYDFGILGTNEKYSIEKYYYKDFDGHLIYDENGDPIAKTTIGELAVEELIDYVSNVLHFIS